MTDINVDALLKEQIEALRVRQEATQQAKAAGVALPELSVEQLVSGLPGAHMDDYRRYTAGADGFLAWLNECAQIEDFGSHAAIRFRPYIAQEEIAEALVAGEWLCIVKARRLGFTWLLVAYAVWLIIFHPMRRVIVLNQAEYYATEFLKRCTFILERLPKWQVPKQTRDRADLLEFNHMDHGSKIQSLAATRRSIRSLDADLVIGDEAAFIDLLRDVMRAAEPALETSKGQLVLLSTSNGPTGPHYETFNKAVAGESKFKPIFYGWKSRPGRTQEWYDEEKRAHADDPLFMKREYPATVEEAWESAEGRIYPLFTRSPEFLRKFDVHPDWPKFRGVDWGGKNPFVCLWVCEIR